MRVRLFERQAGAGGKARPVSLGATDPRTGEAGTAARNDADEVDPGPTVLTMPQVFDELFDRAGASFRSEVRLERSNVLARHTWLDGTTLDLFAEREASADAIGRVFGAADARAYLEFCKDAERIFRIAEEPFIRSQRLTLGGIVLRFGAAGLGALAQLDSHRSMWRSLEQRFRSPRLHQLFGRYATYCGSSPFEAPATMNLVAHVEAEGVYRVEGGMRAVVSALERLCRRLGVECTYGADVESIVVERGRACGVRVAGERFEADAVVFNGDVSALGAGLLGREARRAADATPTGARSISAVTWTLRARAAGAQATGAGLVHHNVFFSDDYRAEFDAMFSRGEMPVEPTLYVCAQDRGDTPLDLPSERLLVLATAPAVGDVAGRWTQAEKERCTQETMNRLTAFGLELSPPLPQPTTPADYHARYPATGGALFGPRSLGARSVLSRVGAASRIPGLYLAGGSVHPGPGVPMVALSGSLAAERICEDLASTVPSRRVATTGTISTA
jgi:1-hydroxycarotenoid 3,4-desaturase